jgi:hypothetical protein
MERGPDSGKEVAVRMLGIVVLAAGILALVYGGFSYSRQTQDIRLGPLEVSVTENHQVPVAVWAGVGLAVVGGGLLVVRRK